MARQGTYSQKSFLRQAPNKLLKQYLARHSIGLGITWDNLKEMNIDSIYRAVQEAPESIQREIDADFREIDALADDGGARTLIEEGRDEHHGVNLAPEFDRMSGALEFAFWVFLEHRSVFDVAGRLDYADDQKFQKRKGLPNPRPDAPEDGNDRLRRNLSDFFCREQGRGRGCKVEHYVRGSKHYYFCFLEDYAETRQVFDEHELVTQRQKPAFEVIFIYDPVARTLETKVRGGKGVREEVERVFGRSILGLDLDPPSDSGIVYELNVLFDRSFEFAICPSDSVERVCLRRLRLKVMGREPRTISLEVGAGLHDKAIWDLYDATLGKGEITKDLMTVMQAGISVVFRPDRKGKVRKLFCTVSHPDACSLKNDPRDEMVKELLARWGIDVSGRDEDSAKKPGFAAQYRLWD